jgi:excisionase family DNA binding protein
MPSSSGQPKKLVHGDMLISVTVADPPRRSTRTGSAAWAIEVNIMTDINDILTLAEAAEQLGLGSSTLRHQAQKGVLRARLIGKTWVTTKAEVARYRHEHLGQVGRPKGC